MMLHIHKRKADNVWTCGRCGWVIDDQSAPQKATCPVCPTIKDKQEGWRPVMVGDLVEWALTKIGITKPLVEKLTRTEGKEGGCGCAGRQKWLNDAGVKAQVAARDALLSFKKFCIGD